jgi:hypothetical protein
MRSVTYLPLATENASRFLSFPTLSITPAPYCTVISSLVIANEGSNVPWLSSLLLSAQGQVATPVQFQLTGKRACFFFFSQARLGPVDRLNECVPQYVIGSKCICSDEK